MSYLRFHVTARILIFKRISMTEEKLTPIARDVAPSTPTGRPADLVAFGLASLAVLLTLSAALWFFFGFAENDTRPEHLTSAFILTSLLFAFAIVPFAIVAKFAWTAHKNGTSPAHFVWTIFLMLPWIALGSLAVIYTPLPVWSGLFMAIVAALLSLWALMSLALDWNARRHNTLQPLQNETLNTHK